jgi:hypothetical protein
LFTDALESFIDALDVEKNALNCFKGDKILVKGIKK